MSFADDIRKFSEKTGVRFNTVRRKFVLDLHADLVRATPVDTGHARANWQVSVGAPAEGIVEGEDKGAKGSDPSAASVAAASSVAMGTAKVHDETMYITNNLPYIERLNDGYSDQAPSGMVEVALASAESRLRYALDKVDS